MKKIITAVVAAAVLATSSVGMTSQAQANDVGLGIAAGILGGVIIGSAISQPHYYAEDGYYRHPRRVYVEDDVVVCKKVLYEDNYGNRYWKRRCHH